MTTNLRRIATLLGSVAVLLLAAVALAAAPASAHPLNTSAVRLDLGTDSVTATIDLPLDELSIARNKQYLAATVVDGPTLDGLRAYVRKHVSATDAAGRSWTTRVSGGQVSTVGGADNLVLHATLAPSSGTVGDFVLHYDAVMDTLISHRVFVSARYGSAGTYTTLAMLSWQSDSVPVASTVPSTSQGFIAAVRLGVEHISSGSDHLLFLLMLLLPAPLVAAGGRWKQQADGGWVGARHTVRRVIHVITAFAVGHSITLALGAFGWIHLPQRLVESGIALSVLVSAVHAIRPLVRRGEIIIGFGFGLLHGLAFATLLGELDLSRGGLVVTLLGFNLGIELTQLLVVALVVPSLLVLSNATSYARFRQIVAGVGVVLAAAWVAERSGLVPVNPLEPLADQLVSHPVLMAAALAVAAAATATQGHVVHRHAASKQTILASSESLVGESFISGRSPTIS